MSTIGVAVLPLRNARTMSSTIARPTPCASARSEARWMTGPSAIGSENGTPSSITSAPAVTNASRIGSVCAGVGSPTVTYGMSAVRPAARSSANAASMRFIPGVARGNRLEPKTRALGDRVHVLVAAAREVDEQDLVLRQRGREACGIGERMRGFERRNDAFDAAAVVERSERFGVGDRHVFRAARVLEPRVLRPHAGIVESRRYRMRGDDLAVRVLQQIRAVAVQHSRPPGGERRGVPARVDAVTGGFDADEAHAGARNVRIEEPDRIR